ncbi:hypothetical protein ACJMK2_019819 [Sinanodonta woodiana]|uniref:Uncharacterized protein n=1 Tax=Sinanodonta woodiana TaxID=1069815 RepID=A0ABD3U0G3_SINWO
MEKVYVNHDHSSELLVKMAELWREDKFCDAFLHLRERTYKVHKLVLIAACPAVLAFQKHKEESKPTEFNFPDGIDSKAVEYVLKYLYDGVIHLSTDNVCKVENLARHLHLNSLINYCLEFRALLLGEEKLKVNQIEHFHHNERPRHVIHKVEVKNDDECSQIVSKMSSMSSSIMFELQTDQDSSHVSSPNIMTFNPVVVKVEPESDHQCTSLKMKNSIETKQDVDKKCPYGMDTDPVYQALLSFSGSPWINMHSTAEGMGTIISDGRKSEMDKCEHMARKVPLSDQKFLQECSVCKKIFTDANRLKRHFRSHSGERPFKCEECGKAFTQACHLMRHKDAHAQLRPYKCECCEKFFTQSAHLKRHRLVHSGERPYRCEVCGKSFSQPNILKSHSRTHSGERPYKCDDCNKAFRESSHLQRHKRLHTGDKPYRCELCNNAYVEKIALKRHVQNHHGNSKEGIEFPIGLLYTTETGNIEESEKGPEHGIEDTMEDSNTDVGDSLEDSNESMVNDKINTVIEESAETIAVKVEQFDGNLYMTK